ncbi:MAG: hypothetical protein M0Q38_07440 [Bacteroidales bacterium]|nr:hypothetical protein [Bacteroidales bacterium]
MITEKSRVAKEEKKSKKVKEKETYRKLDFEDIITLSDKKVKDILKNVEIETLAFAIKGTGKEVKSKIEKNLGIRALKKYKELIQKIKGLKSTELTKYRKKMITEINKTVK